MRNPWTQEEAERLRAEVIRRNPRSAGDGERLALGSGEMMGRFSWDPSWIEEGWPSVSWDYALEGREGRALAAKDGIRIV